MTAPAKKLPEKIKPNLTSVTPALPMAPPPEVDTTTPMDNTVRPFSPDRYPKWKPWLLDRLQRHWPHLTDFNYGGIMNQLANDRMTLFLRADKAIMLAVANRVGLDPRPTCELVFCFKHHPSESEENKDVRLLFRHMEKWAAGLGVKYVRVINSERCDMNFSLTKETLWGEEKRYILKDLDPKELPPMAHHAT